MSQDQQIAEHVIEAYRSLAASRGVDLETVLAAAAAGDLRAIVAKPELRRRHSRLRRLTVGQARVRLMELRWGPGELEGLSGCRRLSVWRARVQLLARRYAPGDLDGTGR